MIVHYRLCDRDTNFTHSSEYELQIDDMIIRDMDKYDAFWHIHDLINKDVQARIYGDPSEDSLMKKIEEVQCEDPAKQAHE